MKPDFSKSPDGLVPAIVQHAFTKTVLMQGYMNAEALSATESSGHVTFFSRSKNRLWTKGETTGHFLELKSMALDCDADSILIQAIPHGPTCHTGAASCWGDESKSNIHFIGHLERIIAERKEDHKAESYTASLFAKGINKIAQKVGEEAVELVIEAKDDNKELFMGEAADLLFHYIVLLQAKGYSLSEVVDVLEKRHK